MMHSYLLGQDPRFYFYPDDAGSNLRTITLSEPITTLDVQAIYKSDAKESIGYQTYRKTYGMAQAVRIVMERFADDDGVRERQLQSLLNHLARGGWVAFSHDHSRTWASRATITPGNGDANITTAGNLFTALSASANISQYDHLVVQSPNPTAKREKVEVSSFTPGTGVITLPASSVVAFDHTADTLVRWEGFLPRLVLPEGGSVTGALTDEYRNTWTLDLTLVTQPDLEHVAIAAE